MLLGAVQRNSRRVICLQDGVRGGRNTSEVANLGHGRAKVIQAGQELFRAVVRSFYRGICAVYLLYTIDNAKTFQELKGWLREVQQHAHEEVVLFLIGARADLAQNREVSRE